MIKNMQILYISIFFFHGLKNHFSLKIYWVRWNQVNILKEETLIFTPLLRCVSKILWRNICFTPQAHSKISNFLFLQKIICSQWNLSQNTLFYHSKNDSRFKKKNSEKQASSNITLKKPFLFKNKVHFCQGNGLQINKKKGELGRSTMRPFHYLPESPEE